MDKLYLLTEDKEPTTMVHLLLSNCKDWKMLAPTHVWHKINKNKQPDGTLKFKFWVSFFALSFWFFFFGDNFG